MYLFTKIVFMKYTYIVFVWLESFVFLYFRMKESTESLKKKKTQNNQKTKSNLWSEVRLFSERMIQNVNMAYSSNL